MKLHAQRLGRHVMTLLLAVPTAIPALALAGPFGEPVVRTEHRIQIGSGSLAYSAETGRVAIRDVETGEPRGYMFYTAYQVDPADAARPVTVVWNGGPGANSALLHFEAAGPRRLDGLELVDNEDTWLTATDLVFVDPIGTGFSRPAKREYADEFYGTVGDVASVTEFVRAWRLLHAAEDRPVVLAGESWGAGRAGSVGFSLLERGVPVRALVLISGGTGLGRDAAPQPLSRALRVVDRAATALHHGRLIGTGIDGRGEAESWVRTVYAPALERLDALDGAERDAIAAGIERFTGLPATLVPRDTLVVSPRAYREGLLNSQGTTLGVFDMRMTQNSDDFGSGQARLQRRRLITSYLRTDLGFRTDLPYLGLESGDAGYAPDGQYPVSVNARWNYATAEVTPEEVEAAIADAVGHGGGPPQLGPPLPSAAEAVGLSRGLRVLVAAGLYDSLNSCAANAEIADGLTGDLKAAYRFECYEGGHMMYRDERARQRLSRDVRELASAVE